MQFDFALGDERVEVEFLDPPSSFLAQWKRVGANRPQTSSCIQPIARIVTKWIREPWVVLRSRLAEKSGPRRQPPILAWNDVAQYIAVKSGSCYARFDSPLSATLFDPGKCTIESFRIIPSDFDLSPNTLLVPALQPVLAARGSLLVHAAGVDLGDFGAIVAGPSGAGKSTAARLLGGHILSDDIILVSSIGHRPVVFSTPLGCVTDGARHCLLGAVLFPKKALAFQLRELSRREASLRFFAEHSSYMVANSFDTLRTAILHLTSRLFDKVPSFEMSFSRDHIDSQAISAAISSAVPGSP